MSSLSDRNSPTEMAKGVEAGQRIETCGTTSGDPESGSEARSREKTAPRRGEHKVAWVFGAVACQFLNEELRDAYSPAVSGLCRTE